MMASDTAGNTSVCEDNNHRFKANLASLRTCSSDGSERTPDKREGKGSIPFRYIAKVWERSKAANALACRARD
jgi:hypothetical protein